ncbi:hypothetical protein LJ707_18785 [Mucilaginibacter sp. UR6-1]|uniref:hypothetical protein n=1 Tax=Mucilaginibacter sp. UR6-1 TaxID=1435643 RepID=UPI001E2DBD89|nr:hypothetical protein [Mucilaginibacter sp. UR6-1]MCC8410993.1 hypothetical protein [Mucilaginibacter sp. UR6-1]
MKNQDNYIAHLDSAFATHEQLPREFSVSFNEVPDSIKPQVKVLFNDQQLGDIINDNSFVNDYYRYHDIFHYTFATLLGWSPCARAMMKKKRKSDPIIDEIEDGARATITEEAVSLIIFNEARKKNFFERKTKVSKVTLRIIKEMTDSFEVNVRTEKEWEKAILSSYKIFRQLIKYNGGKVLFNMNSKQIDFIPLIN